ncbi:hypothetical protein CYLTODRAFT_369342 [Cylindrobasidium torrendii FP15055 ss-10]|uniref:ATPase AAA-type core domain-containing protein n=1 Tax=Cylindrobasidium torrendii FP15055 ss-10 TaxID=1314674 RepID=A0A0D7BPD2_9AGAR|nr:hypothetical protein CYLTODRAFT_369342 [Cylindrobasidium torrendii FP15055 ss-10]
MGVRKKGGATKPLSRAGSKNTLLAHFSKKSVPSDERSTADVFTDDYDVGRGAPDEPFTSSPPNETSQPDTGSVMEHPPTSDASSPIEFVDSDTESHSSQIAPAPNHDSVPVSGTTRNDPIIIESSPVRIRPTPQGRASKAIHPFFDARPRGVSETPTSPTKFSSASGLKLPIPWPTRETQHVRAHQSTRLQHNPAVFASISVTEAPAALEATIAHPSFDRAIYLSSMPPDHAKHPAIVRLNNHTSKSDASQTQLWTERWHPSGADEVLGNEDSARYLRDWLRTLQLEFERPVEPPHPLQLKGKGKAPEKPKKKRPRVNRVISKRKRKRQRVDSDSDEGSWIVDDYEEVDYVDPVAYDDDELADLVKPRRSQQDSASSVAGSLAQSQSNTFTELANTIVLTGPSGSGKTAAVYACAEELGFEVFEVYPGVGKRSSTALEDLVGEVGKNHLVSAAPTKPADSSAKAQFAALLNGSKKESYIEGKTDLLRERTPTAVKQSLILLEEVDILFAEDTNFWVSVKNIIKECRRPVVCTCNDITLVPLYELPIQNVLSFQPCEPTLAVSYLQALCTTQELGIPRTSLSRLYSDISPGSEGPCDDLRFAINSLQFACAGKTRGSADLGIMCNSEGHAGNGDDTDSEGVEKVQRADDPTELPLRQHLALANGLSYMDSHLARVAADSFELFALTEPRDVRDDELGYSILGGEDMRLRLDGVGFGGSLIRDLSTHSRGVHALASRSRFTLPRAQPRESEGHWAELDSLGRQTDVLLRRTMFRAEVLPWMRMIVAADDLEERRLVESAAASVGKRRTRNSAMTSFVRTIPLTEAQRSALDETGLAIF